MLAPPAVPAQRAAPLASAAAIAEPVQLLAAGWARKPPMQRQRFANEVKELLLRIFLRSRGASKEARANAARAVREVQLHFPASPTCG